MPPPGLAMPPPCLAMPPHGTSIPPMMLVPSLHGITSARMTGPPRLAIPRHQVIRSSSIHPGSAISPAHPRRRIPAALKIPVPRCKSHRHLEKIRKNFSILPSKFFNLFEFFFDFFFEIFTIFPSNFLLSKFYSKTRVATR